LRPVRFERPRRLARMTHHPKRKHVHTDRIPIRWGDMDAMGHVNNTVYFRYMESARIGWFESLGITPDPRGQGPVIVNASCNFRKQLVWPGEVELRTYAGAPGRSSFETWVEIRPSYDPEVIYAEGQAKIVWVDFALGKSMPLPERIRQIVES
jgi:acyl-CoA thioester hydrolase